MNSNIDTFTVKFGWNNTEKMAYSAFLTAAVPFGAFVGVFIGKKLVKLIIPDL